MYYVFPTQADGCEVWLQLLNLVTGGQAVSREMASVPGRSVYLVRNVHRTVHITGAMLSPMRLLFRIPRFKGAVVARNGP
jgi:hypothetical protein